MRTTRIAPLVAELESWMRSERARLSRHADVAKAMGSERRKKRGKNMIMWRSFKKVERIRRISAIFVR
jgi:hypothetical protein